MSARWGWLMAVLPAVLVSVAVQAVLAGRLGQMGTDYEAFYAPVAHRIAAGQGVTDNTGAVATRYPPGFPLILAAAEAAAMPFGVPLSTAARWLNVLGYGLMCAGAYGLARRIWSVRAAILVAVLCATYPIAVFMNTYPSSEIWFTACLFAALALWHGGLSPERGATWRMLGAGVSVGLAMLVRPIGVGVGVVLAALIWCALASAPPTRRLWLGGVLLTGNALVVAPWQCYVLATSGKAILLSTAAVPGIRDGLTFGVRLKGYRRPLALPEDVRRLMNSIADEGSSLTTVGAIARTVGSLALQHPVAATKLLAIKAARSWYGTDSQSNETPIIVIQLLYLPLCAWALWRARRSESGVRVLGAALGWLAVYFWCATVAVLPVVRYSATSVVLLFALWPVLLRGASTEPVMRPS